MARTSCAEDLDEAPCSHSEKGGLQMIRSLINQADPAADVMRSEPTTERPDFLKKARGSDAVIRGKTRRRFTVQRQMQQRASVDSPAEENEWQE